MKMVIVPNSLQEAINAKLEAARLEAGISDETWAEEKDGHYQNMVTVYDEYGHLPDFKLVKRAETQHEQAEPGRSEL